MKSYKLLFGLILVFILSMVAPLTARADVAPPQNPSGSNPGPGALTNVRMVAETVTLAIQATDPPTAHVTANFTMRNLGSADENLAVRFPYSMEDGYGNFKAIQNFGVRINGQPADFQTVTAPDTTGFPAIQDWAVFDVSFPVGQDVALKISYDLNGNRQNGPDIAFDYILATGVGWNGTIGSANILVELPYDASPVNVLLDASTPNAQLNGRVVRWNFAELEPTSENNIHIHILPPAIWMQVLAEFDNLKKDPNDGEAWGRLGKAYKQGIFYDKGYPRDDATGREIYRLSAAAYAQAVALKPDDALWHAGYADLLLEYAFWSNFDFANSTMPYTEAVQTGLQELNMAYTLAPDDPTVQSFMETYAQIYGDTAIAQNADGSYTFLWLTQTPTTAPTSTADGANQPASTPVAAAISTATTAPVATQAVALINTATTAPLSPTSAPATGGGGSLCGGAALLPMGLLLFALKRRKVF